jgi:hypothetical protein
MTLITNHFHHGQFYKDGSDVEDNLTISCKIFLNKNNLVLYKIFNLTSMGKDKQWAG